MRHLPRKWYQMPGLSTIKKRITTGSNVAMPPNMAHLLLAYR